MNKRGIDGMYTAVALLIGLIIGIVIAIYGLQQGWIPASLVGLGTPPVQ